MRKSICHRALVFLCVLGGFGVGAGSAVSIARDLMRFDGQVAGAENAR